MPVIKAKDQIIELIKAMPEDATLDQIREKVSFQAELEAAEKELDEGGGLEHNEVKEKLAPWLDE